MAEKSTVHSLSKLSSRRIQAPRGWIIVAYALASWCALALIARQIWLLTFA